jgi:hypothetical protein
MTQGVDLYLHIETCIHTDRERMNEQIAAGASPHVLIQELFDRMLKENNPIYAALLLSDYPDQLNEDQHRIVTKTIVDGYIKKGVINFAAFMLIGCKLSQDQRKEIIEILIDRVLKVGDIDCAQILLQDFSADLGEDQRKQIIVRLLDWVLQAGNVDETLFDRVLEEGSIDKTLFGRVLDSNKGDFDATFLYDLLNESDVDKTSFGRVMKENGIDKVCFYDLLKNSNVRCASILLLNCSDADLSKDGREKTIEILICALKEGVVDCAEDLLQANLSVDQRKEVVETLLNWVRENTDAHYAEYLLQKCVNDLNVDQRKEMEALIYLAEKGQDSYAEYFEQERQLN